jgi:hypothetical protein
MAWVDYDGDSFPDLCLVGEAAALTLFRNVWESGYSYIQGSLSPSRRRELCVLGSDLGKEPDMDRDEGDSSYRRLAAAVIVDAAQDYTEARMTMDGRPGSSRIVEEVDRRSAERFLKGRELNLWAAAAGVEAQALREKVLRLEVRL